jgi:hypothetical protein
MISISYSYCVLYLFDTVSVASCEMQCPCRFMCQIGNSVESTALLVRCCVVSSAVLVQHQNSILGRVRVVSWAESVSCPVSCSLFSFVMSYLGQCARRVGVVCYEDLETYKNCFVTCPNSISVSYLQAVQCQIHCHARVAPRAVCMPSCTVSIFVSRLCATRVLVHNVPPYRVFCFQLVCVSCAVSV